MCIRMQKDRIRSLKILRFVSEFGGLWEHQTNPACTKSVRDFTVLKMDTAEEEEAEEVEEHERVPQATLSAKPAHGRQSLLSPSMSDRFPYRKYDDLSANSPPL